MRLPYGDFYVNDETVHYEMVEEESVLDEAAEAQDKAAPVETHAVGNDVETKKRKRQRKVFVDNQLTYIV